jgi:hypothetical protein
MKLPLLLAAMVLASAGSLPAAECKAGCHTTFVILDCTGAAVADATVQIKLCCGGRSQESATTNASGSASFPHCLSEICERKITTDVAGLNEAQPGNCHTSGNDSTCTVLLCKKSTASR